MQVDNDKRPELLLLNNDWNPSWAAVFGPNFTQPKWIEIPEDILDPMTSRAQFLTGDFDGDSFDEIFAYWDLRGITRMLNFTSSEGKLEAVDCVVHYKSVNDGGFVTKSDYNGDGYPDLVFHLDTSEEKVRRFEGGEDKMNKSAVPDLECKKIAEQP